MDYSNWVDNHKKRMFVVVMSKPQYQEFKYKEDGERTLAHGNISILISTELPDNDIVSNLKARDLVKEGTMLVLSPYDTDYYEDIQESIFEFSKRKIILYSQYCQLLGAKDVSVEVGEEKDQQQQSQHKVKGKYSKVESDLEISQEELERLKKFAEISGTYHGGPPDFQKAMCFLRDKNLYSDQVLRSLINELQNNNKLKTKSFLVNTCLETNNQLRILGKLAVKPISLGLSYDYTKTVNRTYEITVKLKAIFE